MICRNLAIVLLAVLVLHVHGQTPPSWGGNPVYTVKV
jgi:hypothetical protein